MARNIRKLLGLGLGVAALAGLAISCQSYELEEVTPKAFGAVKNPIAITGKMEVPYIMLVVDKSGSMTQPVSSGSTTSKWEDLLEAFANNSSGFLPQSRELARFGLAHFPTDDLCGAGTIDVPLDPNNNNVDVVMSKLRAIDPSGGTPIAPTLDIVRSEPRLVTEEPGRLRFVMLLTDGLPNCNGSSENVQRCNACNSSGGNCTDYQRNECYPTNSDDGYCDEGMTQGVPKGADCLDSNGTVQAITKFREMGVDTFVIGFGLGQGSSLAAVGSWVLNQAAEAGGRARAGETKFYPASNRTELEAALEEILHQTQQCIFALNPTPISAGVVQVSLYDSTDESDTPLQMGAEWTISNDLKSLEVIGDRCSLIQSATPNRYELRINYASQM
jgi:hypothetical protein